MGKRKKARKQAKRQEARLVAWRDMLMYYRLIIENAQQDWPDVGKAQVVVNTAECVIVPRVTNQHWPMFTAVKLEATEHAVFAYPEPLWYGISREDNLLYIRIPTRVNKGA